MLTDGYPRTGLSIVPNANRLNRSKRAPLIPAASILATAFGDQTIDRASVAPNRSNLLHFTFDVGGCLRANGVDTSQMIRMPLQAVDESRPGGTDRTALTISICLPGCTPPTNAGGPQTQGGDGGGPQPGGDGQQGGAPPADSGKPDLAIDDVTAVTNGGNCDITVTVANRGTAVAAPTSVAVSVAGGGGGTFPAQNIAAGSTVTATGSIGGTCSSRAITATADSAGAVDEYHEDNNSWSGSLPCRRFAPSRTGC